MRALLVAAVLLATAAAAREHQPMRPATTGERQQHAAALSADYRYDDLLWENDRIAYRI